MNINKDINLTPKAKSKFRKFVGKFILLLHRWKIVGAINNSQKFVIALGPHTSYWDFVSGIATMLALGVDSKWFIAREFCWWPMGKFMKWLGGISVNRSMRIDLVSKMVEKFKEEEQYLLSIFPEGTTYKTKKWKTGFWYIAKGAEIDIQLVGLDYENRSTIFGPIITVSSKIDYDFETIKDFYKKIIPKNPGKFSV